MAERRGPLDGGATRAPAERGPGRTRRFDPSGPISGLFFLVAAGVFLASGLSGEVVVGLAILVPVVLIGLGVIGIVRILTRSRRRGPR